MPHDRPGSLVLKWDVLYRSCRISTDKRVVQSLCHSRASCKYMHYLPLTDHAGHLPSLIVLCSHQSVHAVTMSDATLEVLLLTGCW